MLLFAILAAANADQDKVFLAASLTDELWEKDQSLRINKFSINKFTLEYYNPNFMLISHFQSTYVHVKYYKL